MKTDRLYPGSKVEISGYLAPCYDFLLNLATAGAYPGFIQEAVRLMQIQPGDKILDLGAGTGRNAVLMMKYLAREGRYLGLDISPVMIARARKKLSAFPNAGIIRGRADRNLPFPARFDKVFISFVLHGFPHHVRERIITFARSVLKKGGEFIILDYNQFSPAEAPLYVRVPFKLVECPYAFDFIRRDWEKILQDKGFNRFEEHLFFRNYVRLLKARKSGSD